MAIDIKVNADTSGAIASLDRLQTKIEQTQDKFEKSFGKMANAALALGAALTAASASALAYADDISDMADAHGYAIGEILAFQKALGASGGKAENAGKAFQALSNKVEEAAGGNLKALSSFEKMGISLADLGNKSNTYIKDQLLDNIAKIEDPMQRNAKAAEFFGKALQGTDIVKFAAQQKAMREEMEKYAPAIKTGGDAFDNLAKIMGNIKLAVLDAFQPLFKFISEINIPVGVMSEGFKVAGVALAYMAGAAVLRGLMALRTALVGIAAAAAANPYVALAGGIAAVATYFALGSKSADDMAESADKASEATKGNIRETDGANEAIQKQRDKLAEVGKELQKNFDIALRKYDQDFKNLRLNEDEKTIAEAIAKINEDGIAAKIKLQNDFSQLSKDDQARVQSDYQKELTLIDQRTAKQTDAVTKQIKNYQDLKTQVQSFSDLIGNLNKFEIQSFEAKAKQLSDASPYLTAIDLEGKLAAATQIRGAYMAATTKLADDGTRDQVRQAITLASTNVDLAASYDEIKAKIYANMEAAVKNGEISSESWDKIREAAGGAIFGITAGAKEFAKVNAEIIEQNRTFSTGWNKAFNDYVTSASNAAQAASGIFNKFSSGLEDYFIGRLKGIQGGWKNFLKGLYEEIARSQIRQGLAKLFSGLGFGSLFAGGAAAGGVAGTTRGQSPTSPIYTQEVSDRLNQIKKDLGITKEGGMGFPKEDGSMWESIKTTISDFADSVSSFMSSMFSGLGNMISSMVSGLGSILSSIGSTLFDVIGSIGGTLWDVISGLGSGLGDILGSLGGGGGGGGGIVSTLLDWGASLFGFANGGIIPGNGPVVVGEKGPELLFGAGGMNVMNNRDSFGGSTNITYNINAVDALSFKSLIAQDPTFLYAVTMQGAKGMPLGR